jgi:gamma-glutamyltranspeptidase/glutathione hydrolase
MPVPVLVRLIGHRFGGRRMMTSRLIFALASACTSFADEPAAQPVGRDTPHPFLAEGREGMVVGLTGRRAVHAGLEVLKQGGSASDAAMATALTQVVEAAGSYVSFAGMLSMTYHDASSGQVHCLNACYNTPLEEKDPLSIPRQDDGGGKGVASGRTALVPGFMAGVQAAHDRFGKLPLAELFRPAVALAEDGFAVDAVLAGYIRFRKDVLSRLPETKRVFTSKSGGFYVDGDLFRQPELAETLRRVAAQGAAYLYSGEWAGRFVDALRRDGGVITARDLAEYRVLWEPPLETTYRDARIFAPGVSSMGGVDTVEALNLVELAALGRSGTPTQSAPSLFWLMQITNNLVVSYASDVIARRFPERDFSPGSRANKVHARWVWGQMQQGTWPYAVPAVVAKERPGHSSGVVAVDRWGNVAAVTHSINAILWGNTGIFVGGISIPDSAAFQQEAILQTKPGSRLRDPMCPVIVTRAGKPVLASSAIGAGLHQRNIQVLARILAFGEDAQSAVDAPAFLLPRWSANRAIAHVGEGAFDRTVIDGVRALGQEVTVLPPGEKEGFVGYWIGIEIDPMTGRLRGAGTSELPSHAEGY